MEIHRSWHTDTVFSHLFLTPCSVMSFGDLKSDITGIFTPQKLENSNSKKFYLESQSLKF